MVKSLPAVQATWAGSRGQEDPLKREWLPTLVVLPRESTDRGARRATVHGVKRAGHDWVTYTYMFTMGYNSFVRRNELLRHAASGMSLRDIIWTNKTRYNTLYDSTRVKTFKNRKSKCRAIEVRGAAALGEDSMDRLAWDFHSWADFV